MLIRRVQGKLLFLGTAKNNQSLISSTKSAEARLIASLNTISA